MMSLFEGRTAIVTGASSGIGRATALLLAEQGAKVALVARSADRLAQVSDEIGADRSLCLPTDLMDPAATKDMIATARRKLGSIDILHANAGIYIGGDVADGDPDDFDALLNTNINGVIRCVREVLPTMREQGAGDIVVTSSVSGHQAIHWEPIYSASKHALQSFVHGLRNQLGKENIRVGAIAPGVVLNELWGATDPDAIAKSIALGEGLHSEDIAEAISFMLSRPRHVTIRDLVILPRTQVI